MQTKTIVYREEDTLLEARVVIGEGGGKRPAILIFPAWEGRGPFSEKKAEEFAEEGFIGIAVDMYGKGRFGKTREEKQALMHPLISDRKALKRRLLACEQIYDSVPEIDSKAVGAIGFCFGGLCALDLARSGADVKGVVSVHGLLGKGEESETPIGAKILALHGNNDPMVSSEEIRAFTEEMDKRKADWQFHLFGGAMHAFTNPEANDPGFGTVYHKRSDERSRVLIREFFRETLGR